VPFGRFFLPGPTDVRPEILAAQGAPMLPHRGPDFEALFARVVAGLRPVFRTARPVYVSTSSGTGLMEMAVRCAPPGRLLALVHGAFAARFADIARACDRAVDVVEVPWGGVPDADDVARRCATTRYAAVTVVHSESSTGALADVAAIARAAATHGALCLVDSVTGIAGAPCETDAWGLGFVLTGSQKALALPPGLAFAVASAEFVHRAAEAPARGRYFDVLEFEAFAAKHQTPNTPAVSLLHALDAQVAAIAREGVVARWDRHAAMRTRTEAWAAARGVAFAAPAGARSPTVSCLVAPPGHTGTAIARAMAERGYVIGSGYGAWKDRTFRIGHMGDHTVATLDGCLAALDEVLGG
jgi:aspartate aminotransferase-like enzyme